MVNLLCERLRFCSDENEPFWEVGLMLPPNLLLERFTTNKVELLQNQFGTWPCRKFPDRSRTSNLDMFLRYFQEMFPLRFLDERFIPLITAFEQLEPVSNQEELNPDTDWNAFDTSSWSSFLHEDSTRITTSERRMKNVQQGFIFLTPPLQCRVPIIPQW